MLRRQLLFAALAAALSTGAVSCRSANAYDVNQQGTGVVLVVQNQNFADVDVYAIGAGLPTRVGSVTGNSSQSFKLSESMYRFGDFRIVATPIGGNGRASTGTLSIAPGQTIYFTIAASMNQSTVSVR
jgi:hypothetical protein